MKPQSSVSSTADQVSGTAAATAPPKNRVEDWLVAISLAHLSLISAWFPMLYDADKGYFNRIPILAPSLLALLVNLAGLTLLIWAVLNRTRSRPKLLWQLASVALFCLLLLNPLDFLRANGLHMSPRMILEGIKGPVWILFLGLLISGVFWRPRLAARIVYHTVGILSPLALFTVARVMLLSLGIVHLAQAVNDPPLAPLLPLKPESPRIIWIIFDAMDQRLVFERRPATLDLPEIDRFRNMAIMETNAYSPANGTFLSLASLMTGRMFAYGKVESASELKLTLVGTNSNQSVLWSTLPSVFDSARELGFNSAVVGWYHPYRRLLARAVSSCSWYPLPLFEPARAQSFTGSLARQLESCAGPFHRRILYADLCRASLEDALSISTNLNYRLLFFHLPPPHTPGIFDPKAGRFCLGGMSESSGFFDNMVLVDHWLGKLRTTLERAGEWNQTWVLITADHCWPGAESFTGSRDLRVPFLLKSPGANSPVTCAVRINTVEIHDLLLAVLTGAIKSEQDALAWLFSHPNYAVTSLDSGPNY